MNTTTPLLLTVLVLWFSHFLVDFMIGIWAVYKTMAHLDLAICGLISGLSAFIGEGLQAIFGPLSDRGHRHKLILFGVLLTITSSLMAYTENYYLLFACFLLTCIGSGAFHPAAVSLLNDITKNRKGALTALFQSGGGLGIAISQMVFSYTFFAMDGNTIILAIPTIFLVLYIFLQPKVVSYPSLSPPRKVRLREFLEFFKDPNLSNLYIFQVCNQSIFWATIFMMPDVLLSRGYETWVCFGGGHFAFIMGSTLLVIPGGHLADIYSPRTVLVASTAVCMAAFYAFLWIPLLSTPALLAILFILGSSAGITNPVAIVFGNRLMPNRSGMVSAFLMGLVWCIAEGLGQFGSGLLSKLFEDDAPAKALSCLGMLFILALAVCTRLPKEAPAQETQAI